MACLLGLIVLAPSASFSFNRDHYPPGEHPPTCRFGRKCMKRGCTHATTFSSTLDGALTYTDESASPISVTRVSARECMGSTWRVRERIDVIPRLIRLPWRPANERTSVHARFSLFALSIQINSVCLTEGPEHSSA